MATKLKVTLVKSLIGQVKKNKTQIAALGLRKMNQSVILPDTLDIRGKIHRAKHMLLVESVELADDAVPAPKKKTKAVATPVAETKPAPKKKVEAAAAVEEKPKTTRATKKKTETKED